MRKQELASAATSESVANHGIALRYANLVRPRFTDFGARVSRSRANLRFWRTRDDHVLEKPFQHTLDLLQECGGIAFVLVETTGKTKFYNLMPSGAREGVKNI
jgi:hypothetical protein